jgi:predicted chitinase
MAVPIQPARETGSGNTKIQKLIQAAPASLREQASKVIPILYDASLKNGVTDAGQIAYILATAEHESKLGRLMEERQWIKDVAANNAYFEKRYQGRADLGNTQPGDGIKFKGRGFCQITGRVNYQRWSQKLGVNLLDNPDLAARDLNIATRILVVGMKEGSFTSHNLARYILGGNRDFVNARRIINAIGDPKNAANDAEKKKATQLCKEAAERYFRALS